MTISRLPDGATPETARALETVVREVLGAIGEEVDVQLGSWHGDDGRVQFVCRVEGPPADAFTPEPQWRWWSRLLDGPEDLREELMAAVHRQQVRSIPETARAPHQAVATGVRT
ncbi:MAG TPA: hypothetical protein VMR21_15570 [Vicinamibacteria bacterium]|nr:hypothetical protein [Vicinamibacteria bacterium]